MGKQAQANKEPSNKKRRALLKIGLTGVAAFALGKIVGPRIDDLIHPEDKIIDRKDFASFSLIETNGEMKLSDKEGNEIFVIDKESFK